MLARVEQGRRLPQDPWLALVPPPAPQRAAVVSFPGHIVVAADVDRPWLDSWMRDGDFGAPTSPPFLHALEERLRLNAGLLDALLLAPPVSGAASSAGTLSSTAASLAAGDPPLELQRVDAAAAEDHPRTARARRFRTDIRVYAHSGSVLVLGRGVGGRWEAAIEVDESARNRGLGRRLAYAARRLVPDGRPVWAQVAPGNAASLRAFLAAGFQPVGSEVLLMPWGVAD